MARDFDPPLTLPRPYYSAIGEIIHRWALFEFQMQAIIWRAMRLDNKQGRTLTVGMNAKVLISVLGTLNRKWAANQTEKRAIKSLIRHAREVVDDRNHVAHGAWMYPRGGNPTDLYLHYMKESHQRIMPRAVKKRPRDLKATANKIKILNQRAEKLLHRLEERQGTLT